MRGKSIEIRLEMREVSVRKKQKFFVAISQNGFVAPLIRCDIFLVKKNKIEIEFQKEKLKIYVN